MWFSLPPTRSTAAPRGWLRLAVGVALGLFAAMQASPAAARPAPVRVLVATSVGDSAKSSMTATLWAKIVANYVNAETVPFSGRPTLDDCHKAKAAYMVDAPFDLRPRLPGIASSNSRVGAITHIVVTNCITGVIPFDRTIPLDSDPASSANAGDFEAVPEASWSQIVPAELSRYPIFFPHVARIARVTPPFAYIEMTGSPLAVGDMLRAFASADAAPKTPVILTVTLLEGKYAQCVYSTENGSAAPDVGDYVEPLSTASPSPAATPSARP